MVSNCSSWVLYEVSRCHGAIMVKTDSWVGAVSLLVLPTLFGVRHNRHLPLLLDQIGENFKETMLKPPNSYHYLFIGTFCYRGHCCGVWPGISHCIFLLQLSLRIHFSSNVTIRSNIPSFLYRFNKATQVSTRVSYCRSVKSWGTDFTYFLFYWFDANE
jgi:hypothetical protein